MKPTRKPAKKKVTIHKPSTTRDAPPQPPACYQEALLDSEGNRVPLLPEELREGALRYTESRHRTGLGILRRYLNPTVTWPMGKDAVIEERIGHATGNTTAIQSFASLLRAAGIEPDRGVSTPVL